MARDKNTYAKRQRETLKRLKAEAKRERRKKRQDGTEEPDNTPGTEQVLGEVVGEPLQPVP